MARVYSRRKKRSDGAFVLIFVLIYLYWGQRKFLVRVEHVFPYILLAIAVIIGLLVITKLRKSWISWRNIHNPEMKLIDNMTGIEFEKCIAKLLKNQGYRHIQITEKYDYGVDIVAEKNGVRWGVQVKRNSGLVKVIAVRQVVTALKKYKCDKAMVVTNSHFSVVASELAKSNDCMLIDRSKLFKWVVSSS